MNSKLVIIGLMILSLFAISLSGQKLTTQQVILQDDKPENHLIFVIPSGEYKFENCKGNLSGGGVGSVSVIGCQVALQDISDTRRVLAEVDLCARTGKADIAVEVPILLTRIDSPEFIISDSNIGDSAFDCESKTVDPK